MITQILPVFQTILAFCNIVLIGYGLFRFLSKPHNNLENRVNTLEVKVKEIDNSLKIGNDHFRDLDEKSEVFMECMLAFIDFEIAYCQATGYAQTEDIVKAKSALRNYLKKR
ncbi:MAG: hypothetical protein IKP50_00465 [Bacilli bacterium]|nr:hypothetical protein [Bacilli bacterium]